MHLCGTRRYEQPEREGAREPGRFQIGFLDTVGVVGKQRGDHGSSPSRNRMTGDLDYLIHVRVADVAEYDRLYQRLTARVEIDDISASFVMEEIKETTALPLLRVGHGFQDRVARPAGAAIRHGPSIIVALAGNPPRPLRRHACAFARPNVHSCTINVQITFA